MLPTHERFDTGNLPGRELYLWLVNSKNFSALGSPAQLAFKIKPVR